MAGSFEMLQSANFTLYTFFWVIFAYEKYYSIERYGTHSKPVLNNYWKHMITTAPCLLSVNHYLLYFTLLYFTLLYFTLLYFTLLYFTLLYFTLLYFTLLYFTLLYFTLLYFTLLYFTLLYFRRRRQY